MLLKYTDTEIREAVQASLVHLSTNNYYTYLYDSDDDAIYPSVTDREENLVAILSSIILNPDNQSIRLPNLSVIAPNDDPLDKKLARVITRFKKDGPGVFFITEF